MSRVERMRKIRLKNTIIGSIKLVIGVGVGTPFILGIIMGDLDATTATYKLVFDILWGMGAWIIPIVFIAYKLYKNRRLFI